VGNTDWIFVIECKFQSVGVALIDGVVVQNLNVHLPFFQVVTLDDCDSRGYMFFHLEGARH